jgi:hypothetical protein
LRLFAPIFQKYVEVFGIPVVARHDVSDRKLLHTGGILAQFLDNDEDGVPDNEVSKVLVERGAAVLIFSDESERSTFLDLNFMR